MKQVLSVFCTKVDGVLITSEFSITNVLVPDHDNKDFQLQCFESKSESMFGVSNALLISNLFMGVPKDFVCFVSVKHDEGENFHAFVNNSEDVMLAEDLYAQLLKHFNVEIKSKDIVDWTKINYRHKYDTAENTEHPMDHKCFKLYGDLFPTSWRCIDITTVYEPVFVINNTWHIPLRVAMRHGLLR